MDIFIWGLLAGLGFWVSFGIIAAAIALVVVLVMFVFYLKGERREKRKEQMKRGSYE